MIAAPRRLARRCPGLVTASDPARSRSPSLRLDAVDGRRGSLAIACEPSSLRSTRSVDIDVAPDRIVLLPCRHRRSCQDRRHLLELAAARESAEVVASELRAEGREAWARNADALMARAEALRARLGDAGPR